MRLEIEHRTEYEYAAPVRMSHNEARMTPLTTGSQTCVSAAFEVDPKPSYMTTWRDYFGTIVTSFDVMALHTHLRVVQRADVLTQIAEDDAAAGAAEYLFASPMVRWNGAVTQLAASLRAPTAEGSVRNVMDWFGEAMTYEQGATVVGTPVAEIISHRRGVCQDYAHVCCALLRSLEIPARYVSGYFAPRPLSAGEEVLAESHAWVQASLDGRWVSLDPTNNDPVGGRHVTVGYGRDYSDVVPFAGVHMGAASQTLSVSVAITGGRD